MVAHWSGGRGVVGSNPAVPTKKKGLTNDWGNSKY